MAKNIHLQMWKTFAIWFAFLCDLASKPSGRYQYQVKNLKVFQHILHLNPKRHGLFGQLNTWGERILPILEKRSVTPSNFTLEQQTVSYMKAEVFS